MLDTKPLDIIVFDGQSSILHSLIEWRCLDKAVHCVVAADSLGSLYDPTPKGIIRSNILDYTGRTYSIHRYNKEFDSGKLIQWCNSTIKDCIGYDYRQWLFGFVLGIQARSISNCPNKWTCAEFPYWMFQENGYTITVKDEVLPMPRMFRYNPCFSLISNGTV